MMATAADILLVEDNPADAEFVIAALQSENAGTTIAHVHDGAEALDFIFARGSYAHRAHATPPRLVILDIKLPKVDGFTVLRELRAFGPTRTIPIVMLTSSNVERDVALCYQLGVTSYVQKPVVFDDFRATVRLIGQYWLGANIPAPVAYLSGGPAP